MSGPHVAGLAALLISAQPGLRGQVGTIAHLIAQTSIPRQAFQTCGGIPAGQVPNNVYGHGRIDAWNAFEALPHFERDLISSIVRPGQPVTITLSLDNSPQFPTMEQVVISDTIPAGVTLITASGPVSVEGDILTWTVGDVPPGEKVTLTYVVRIPEDAMPQLEFSGAPAMLTTDSLSQPMDLPALVLVVGHDLFLPGVTAGE